MDKTSSSYSTDNSGHSKHFDDNSRRKLSERIVHSLSGALEEKSQDPSDDINLIKRVLGDKNRYKSDLSNKKIFIEIDSFLHLKECIINRIVDQQQKANDLGPPYNDGRFKNNMRIQSDCENAIKRITQTEDPMMEQKAIVREWLRSDNKTLSNVTKDLLVERDNDRIIHIIANIKSGDMAYYKPRFQTYAREGSDTSKNTKKSSEHVVDAIEAFQRFQVRDEAKKATVDKIWTDAAENAIKYYKELSNRYKSNEYSQAVKRLIDNANLLDKGDKQ